MDKKKQIATILVVIATVILAGIAIFTAVRLYQLRQEAVAPTAPTSEPEAAKKETESCDELAFTLGTATPTATPTDSPTPTPTSTATSTPTSTPTPTSTTTTTASSSSSTSSDLPDAGVSLPTILSAGFGILVIVSSVLLII